MGSVIYGLESKVRKWPQRETPNRKNENGNVDKAFKDVSKHICFLCVLAKESVFFYVRKRCEMYIEKRMQNIVRTVAIYVCSQGRITFKRNMENGKH